MCPRKSPKIFRQTIAICANPKVASVKTVTLRFGAGNHLEFAITPSVVSLSKVARTIGAILLRNI